MIYIYICDIYIYICNISYVYIIITYIYTSHTHIYIYMHMDCDASCVRSMHSMYSFDIYSGHRAGHGAAPPNTPGRAGSTAGRAEQGATETPLSHRWSMADV